MSIRLKKSIGWGLELDASQVDEERFSALAYGEAWLNYDDFNEFIHELDFPLKPVLEKSIVLNSERIKHGIEPINRQGDFDIDWSRNFMQFFYGEYDHDANEEEDNRRLILTPHSATHDVFSGDLTNNTNAEDEAFAYAEFEMFFPTAETYTNQSFTFKSPPFPDSYEVIGADPVSTVKDLVYPKIDRGSLSSLSFIRSLLVSRLMEGVQGNEEFEESANMSAWKLSAPLINMALVEFSGVLKNNSTVFGMQPRVVYSWS